MIDTTLCFECGTDTQYDGWVDRIWWGYLKQQIKGYRCGPCEGQMEFTDCLPSEDDDKWDSYLADRIKYVDQRFPDAPKFRELMDTESEWTEADITQVQKVIDSYRRITDG